MVERTIQTGKMFLLLNLVAAYDAGLILYKYFVDSEFLTRTTVQIASGTYLVSLILYLLILSVIFFAGYLVMQGSTKLYSIFIYLVTGVFGFGVIVHKHRYLLRNTVSSDNDLYLYMIIFVVLVALIWKIKHVRMWTVAVVGLNLLIAVTLLIPRETIDGNHNSRREGPNIIMIIVDTMRFDRLGCYGNTDGLTPAIDEIAKKAQVYENAYVHWPASGPSHSSMLTGKTVYDHAAKNGCELGLKYTTLAEVLKKHDYKTGGFVQNRLLNFKNHYDQGFDVFVTDEITKFKNVPRKVLIDHLLPVVVLYHLQERDRFTDEAINWLRENDGEKLFLFLQFFHPHIPYTPPRRLIRNDNYHGVIDGSLEQSRLIRNGDLIVTDDDIDYMIDLYEAEIRYSDEQIRKVYEYMKEAKMIDNSILLITADHGENLFEHTKFFAHGNELYESTVHIPLVISYPEGGIVKGRIHETFRDIDFMPYLLTLSGIDYDELDISSSPYINDSLEILGITCNAEQVLIYTKLGNMKYILNVRTMNEELYDLIGDRNELNNLCESDPGLCENYRELVMTEMKENSLIGNFIDSSCIEESHDKETEDLLRTLGYIQ